MVAIFAVPRWFLFTLLSLSCALVLLLSVQIFSGLWNAIRNARRHLPISERPIFNLYIFHHLIICTIRSLVTSIICVFLIFYDECVALEFFIHFLLLLSTFDVLLIIVGETAHFWDSSINHESTLYSKRFLAFGICFTYFVSGLFLSIHITIGGENPLVISVCKTMTFKLFFNQNHELEASSIPTIILYVFFLLLDVLTFVWIYVAYRDIAKLKRKRLATVFFYSLVFTKYKGNERSIMVNQSLKRLSSIGLFVSSNILVILPILTLKIANITLPPLLHLLVIYFTVLPWCESVTFLFFPEMKYRSNRSPSRSTKNRRLQQRIGSRLSAYRESEFDVQIDEKN